MKYRKKPVVIDALQWTGKNHREMFDFLTDYQCTDQYIPDFPANDILNAIAVGIVSGLSSTGVNQIYKQVKNNA